MTLKKSPNTWKVGGLMTDLTRPLRSTTTPWRQDITFWPKDFKLWPLCLKRKSTRWRQLFMISLRGNSILFSLGNEKPRNPRHTWSLFRRGWRSEKFGNAEKRVLEAKRFRHIETLPINPRNSWARIDRAVCRELKLTRTVNQDFFSIASCINFTTYI